MVLQEMMQSLMTGLVPCFETLLEMEATLISFKKNRNLSSFYKLLKNQMQYIFHYIMYNSR
jgi:hypothetical protein